ncbi:P-selectin-like [Styela clava]
MSRPILLIGVISLSLIAGTYGIRCLECFGVADDAACKAQGQIRECRWNQDACEIELRWHEGWGGHILMYKQCKQSKACDNNHIQNPRDAWAPTQCNPDDFNSVCRCCCYTDECNVAREDCFGKPGCPLLPTTIHRGKVDCTKGREPGSVCTTTCQPGSVLLGSAVTYCRYDGYWSRPLPRCIVEQCEERDLANGWYICTNSYYVGSECTANCRPGFELVGAKVHTCLGSTTKWSARWNYWPPRCTPIQCPDRGTVEFGTVDCTDGNNVQSRCKVVCDENHRLEGIADSYCEDKGTWSHPLPVCTKIQCPIRGQIINGRVDCTDGVEVGSVCTADCDESYRPDGVKVSECLPSGQWSTNLPRCEMITCPARGEVMFGTVDCSDGVFAGSTCNVECMSGTRLVGIEISSCMEVGLWDYELPRCERVECPPRGTIDGGVVSCSNKGFVGSICLSRCNMGSAMSGTVNSVCLPSGEWSVPLPSCSRIVCPALDFSLQPGTMTCTNEFFYRSTCSFRCDEGYFVFGALQVGCRLNGMWTTRVPECREIRCGNRGRVANGVVTCSDGNEVGSSCDVTCNPGYSLRGRVTTNCQGNGRWDFRQAVCETQNCPPRGRLFGGTVTCFDGNAFGSVCTARCNAGSELVGASVSTCEAGGVWSIGLPTCVSRPCSNQGDLEFGEISCSNGWNVQSQCTFTCTEPNYQLFPEGRQKNLCLPTQSWNVPKPCCARPCPPWAVMDIVLVLDSSSSIEPENWVELTRFVRGIIRSFRVEPDAANFAIFRFNKVVDEVNQILLNSYPGDVEGLIEAFNRIPYDGSGTWTGNALNHALTVSLSPENGNRPDVPDFVFVITDGKAGDDVEAPAEALRRSGAKILVLGIEPPSGRGLTQEILDQLLVIAGQPQNLIIADDGFAGLTDDFSLLLSRNICGDPCE